LATGFFTTLYRPLAHLLSGASNLGNSPLLDINYQIIRESQDIFITEVDVCFFCRWALC